MPLYKDAAVFFQTLDGALDTDGRPSPSSFRLGANLRDCMVVFVMWRIWGGENFVTPNRLKFNRSVYRD